ncbi:MAG: NAD(+) diphosphatase [Limimaricola sp.]|uniref:NAD(+) diphosphatase n=1 Tax=Limimaricola sp. TaxID=2211665 RepID=UPI001D41EEB4|nr:NAD(+) diphosphatase [Limimaricola sp.]MBI1417465.1 NAD(+) diphosphatase [Limimaricola sp.]
MKIAETVTFGGGGLDRAAEQRGKASAEAGPLAQTIVLWRGKPLVIGEARDRLARLPLGHPALAQRHEAPLYLGRAAGEDLFAVDLSAWQPAVADPDTLGGFFDPSEQHHPDLPADHVFVELRGVMTRLSPLDAECAATARAIVGWHDSHRYCARCGAASQPVQSGWQRDCPACGTHHFPRTDPVVIMLITHGNDVLLGRSPGWPEGMYSLLAGFIEPGETIEAAVRREVWEEAGVRVGPVGYLASQPWPFPASLMFGCQGRAETREITLDPVELEDALWVGREEMVQVFAGAHPRIKPARSGAIAHFLLRNWLADRLD